MITGTALRRLDPDRRRIVAVAVVEQQDRTGFSVPETSDRRSLARTGRSESQTPSDQPNGFAAPSERAIDVTHGLRNPCGARKNAAGTPDAFSIASVPSVRSVRT